MALIEFRSDWTHRVVGSVKPGARLELQYAIARLPALRDAYEGLATWSLIAHVRFSGDEEFVPVPLDLRGSEIATGTIHLPPSAQRFEVWFQQQDNWIVDDGFMRPRQPSHYDSRYAVNYHFDIAPGDILAVRVLAVASPVVREGIAYPRYEVETAARVTAVTVVTYPVTKGDDVVYCRQLRLTDLRSGKAWVGGSVRAFSGEYRLFVAYSVGDTRFIDDHMGEGYLFDAGTLPAYVEEETSRDAADPIRAQRTVQKR
jgi:hypothetical protein